jgi:hypothetical protein
MSPLLVFNRVYRMEIHSVMLVLSTPLVNCCPSIFSLTSPTPPPLPKVDYILQEFNTLFLTRFSTYKIATPSQTKTPVKTTFRDWCLYFPSSMAYKLLNIVEKFEYVTHGLNNYTEDNHFWRNYWRSIYGKNFCGLAFRLCPQICVSLSAMN